MALMRHDGIETTQRYYAGRNANTTAAAVWKAYRRSQEGKLLGIAAQNRPAAEVDSETATSSEMKRY
jgi:hypothetical protein